MQVPQKCIFINYNKYNYNYKNLYFIFVKDTFLIFYFFQIMIQVCTPTFFSRSEGSYFVLDGCTCFLKKKKNVYYYFYFFFKTI